MTVALILNPNAGAFAQAKNELTRPALVDALHDAGFTLQPGFDEGAEDGPQAGEARSLAAKIDAALADADVEAILTGGGDGTVSCAAGRLAGKSTALAVLPLGTLNHFAADLGIPSVWRDAVAALAQGQIRTVDVAEVNGRIFVNNCALGSYPEAVKRRDALRQTKGHGKWAAMALASFSVWRELRRMRVRIEIAGATLQRRTAFVLVANNRYRGHVLGASLRPRLDEGKLWLYTTRAHRSSELIRMLWQGVTRPIDEADGLEVEAAAELTIRSDRSMPVAADGEIIGVKSPLQFRVRPGALRVLAPATPSSPA